MLVTFTLGFAPAGVALAGPSNQTPQIYVTLLDGRMNVAPTALSPGPLTLVVANRGRLRHTFVISGNGLLPTRTLKLGSGKSATLKLTLKAGRYAMSESVDGAAKRVTMLKVANSQTTGATGGSAWSGVSTWGSGSGSTAWTPTTSTNPDDARPGCGG